MIVVVTTGHDQATGDLAGIGAAEIAAIIHCMLRVCVRSRLLYLVQEVVGRWCCVGTCKGRVRDARAAATDWCAARGSSRLFVRR